MTYYNEIEPYAAEWLRNLIQAGLLPDGEVDERSIEDVTPNDLRGFRQCHFFAGIGLWAYAVRLAGYEHVEGLWTGSCPCQPFSTAGKREGFDDERHLWPAWFWLIQQSRPAIVFGEQVAGSAGRAWLDLVSDDLEGIGYTFGAANLPACSVGAPHSQGNHDKPVLMLPGMAEQASWVTPASRDWKDTPGSATTGINPDGSERSRLDRLPMQAFQAGYPTPKSSDTHTSNVTSGPRGNPNLLGVVVQAGYPTPKASNTNGAGEHGTGGPNLQAVATRGQTSSGSPSKTGKSARLNPALPRWLLGIPATWDEYAPTETPSSLKSRRRSSKQQ